MEKREQEVPENILQLPKDWDVHGLSLGEE